jgi:uncharacterized repeat protein (TIGR03803 family)
MREQRHTPTFSLKLLSFAIAIASLLAVPAARAQTYTVLHNFTGGADGGNPYAGLTADAAGNLYGTASTGGISSSCNGCGTVFKLADHSNAWTFSVLYSFRGRPDGYQPEARVVFGPDGLLYGTTVVGGADGSGTVYKLQPLPNICPSISCEWTETVLHSFANAPDGQNPARGDVVFDSAGNLYGATTTGGNSGNCANDESCGTVYEVMPSSGGWLESVIYNFEGQNDGAFPNGVMLDSSGDLDGTTNFRGANMYGTVFSLTPNGQGQWNETSLYSFSDQQDGGGPLAGVISDGAGGFYGTTSYGGSGNGGTAWQLTSSGSNWLLNILASLNYSGMQGLTPQGSAAVLTTDTAGNLYGTTVLDGAYDQGSVFKLTYANGNWTLTTLYNFTGGADGGRPYGQVILDSNGNIYGTTSIGGSSVGQCYQNLGCGVAFEITP